jgi:hypothetical protein
MRVIGRALVALGSVAIIVGFFLPFFDFYSAAFWDATRGPQAWMVWTLLLMGGLAAILLIAPSKLTGLIHLLLGIGSIMLIYFVLRTPELGSIFGKFQMPEYHALFSSWSSFTTFFFSLDLGGLFMLGGSASMLLGGVFELFS